MDFSLGHAKNKAQQKEAAEINAAPLRKLLISFSLR